MPLAERIGWVPRQRHSNFYNLPGAKVIITFRTLIAKSMTSEERSQPPPQAYLPETIPLPAGLYTSVVQNIFYYILSALFQGRGIPLAVKWVRKPQNAALTPTSSCCESAKSLILTMNQHWQQSIKETGLMSEATSPRSAKTQGIRSIIWQLKSILFYHHFPLLCLGKTCAIYPSESSDLWSHLASSCSLVPLSCNIISGAQNCDKISTQHDMCLGESKTSNSILIFK